MGHNLYLLLYKVHRFIFFNRFEQMKCADVAQPAGPCIGFTRDTNVDEVAASASVTYA